MEGGGGRWRGWRGLENQDKAEERVGMLEARMSVRDRRSGRGY